MNISFFVEGPCIPKGRPRVTRHGHTYTPQRTKDYESTVGWAAKQAMREMFANMRMFPAPTRNHVRLNITIYPANKRRKDIDNVLKAVMDGMNGIVYEDDSQVDRVRIQQMDLGSKVGVQVEVEL